MNNSIKPWQYVVSVLVVIILIVIGIAIFRKPSNPSPDAPGLPRTNETSQNDLPTKEADISPWKE